MSTAKIESRLCVIIFLIFDGNKNFVIGLAFTRTEEITWLQAWKKIIRVMHSIMYNSAVRETFLFCNWTQ